jgi:hypothetical protein
MGNNIRSIYLRCVFLGTIVFCCFMQANAQSASFLGDGTQDFVRREQLLGKANAKNGLLLQSFSSVYAAVDSLLPPWKAFAKKPSKTISPVVTWLPFSSTIQYNSHHPYGWNDGAMIPAKGLQTTISGGIAATVGKFSLVLKPELVYAKNPEFEGFSTENGDIYWAEMYKLLNKIDMPERFGSNAYHKILPGQSSIRYNTGSFSAGVSTENIWWGPGRYNALVMSNNAPGFAHITVNTVKPIETGIGSFEGQLIAGSLSSSGIFPPDTNRYYNGVRLYQAKQEKARYVTGFMLSWQPKWVKGLFVGFAKTSYLYSSDLGIADIFPLDGLIRSGSEKAGKKASLGSLFARYVMPEERAELYFEYGRNDKSASLINIIADNRYARGYVAGFRKLFASRRKHFIEFAAEFTQLQLPTAGLVQQAVSWYAHPSVRQGYTHEGQVLGSGIGPGSNSQLVDISWVKDFTKVGLRFERITRNNDFYYSAFVHTDDFTRHWIDISTTLHADWQYKQFIFSSRMGLIRSLNYEWYIFPGLGYFKNGYDVLNFHANVSVAFRL